MSERETEADRIRCMGTEALRQLRDGGIPKEGVDVLADTMQGLCLVTGDLLDLHLTICEGQFRLLLIPPDSDPRDAELARLRHELAAQTGAMAAEIGRLAGLLDECRDLLLVFVVEGRLDHGQAAELLDKLPNWPPTPGEAGGGRER